MIVIEAVLRNCSKLRVTNIYIYEELSPTSQAIKEKKEEGKIAYFSHVRLIVEKRPGEAGGDGDVEKGGDVNKESRQCYGRD